MNCIECENLLAAYISGDLDEERSAACKLHLAECASCRESMELYSCLVDSISGSPMLIPTEAESFNLARSLKDVRLPSPIQPRLTWRQLFERVALAVMCIVSFVTVAFITLAIRNGQVSISAFANPIVLLPSIVIIIFIVSFLPIFITARRKPLNGMTFKR